MKTLIAIFMMLTLVSVTGCWNTSHKGGVVPVNEEFSITVPSSTTVKQGEEATINATLNRGADFKQDVQLNINADGVGVTPTSVLVKGSDKPDLQIQITAPKNAAIGSYLVSIDGTPTSGRAASTTCKVNVIAP